MKKSFNKRVLAVTALSLLSLSLFLKIVPFGPKLPPVEFTQTLERTEMFRHV